MFIHVWRYILLLMSFSLETILNNHCICISLLLLPKKKKNCSKKSGCVGLSNDPLKSLGFVMVNETKYDVRPLGE
jgi:hypothetical protein